VSTPADESDRATGVERHPPLAAEPSVHFERTPGKVEVDVGSLDSLFDWDGMPTYPHTGPMLNATVAEFILDTAREDRHSSGIEIIVGFRDSPIRPEEEAGLRAKLSSYFANEVEVAELGMRVNRIEALGSLRFALPIVVVAAFFAGLLSSPSTFHIPDYLDTFAYLIVVVIIWLMVWDPIEKLFFDSYFIRLRIRALQKLVAAKIVFVNRPATATPTNPSSSQVSALDTIQKVLEG
jgi:hypothetical protein